MSAATEPVPSRIGLVLVHGVGEQRRFDHLSAEVKNLVAGLMALPGHRVTVETRATQDSAVGAEHESWRADGSAPVVIHVSADKQRYCLCVHEVWWADLDDKDTLWNRFKFWLWGLGFWLPKPYRTATLQGGMLDMQPPQFTPFKWGGRLLRAVVVAARLWAFAVVFLLSALTVNLINYLLKQLKLGEIPGVEVFYQFVGDVKLYQDRGGVRRGPLSDLDDRRRVAIRRRMINVLVDAYRAGYDRWYVLAHSLGTVVALNGIMETAHSLPNYLSRETYAALVAKNDAVLSTLPDDQSRSVDNMRPARPVWLTNDKQTLDRAVLFNKLRGLVTYGSPLDKFAYLWSQIVNINKDTSPWAVGEKRPLPFEWLNVFEHTDPVSAGLAAYAGGDVPAGSPAPVNMAYKAGPALLLSHLQYLKLRRGPTDDQFVVRLVRWILDSSSTFPQPQKADRHWYQNTSPLYGVALRTPWWVVGTAFFTLLLAAFGVPALIEVLRFVFGLPLIDALGLEASLTNLSTSFAAQSSAGKAGWVLGVAVGTVTIAGPIRWLLERKL